MKRCTLIGCLVLGGAAVAASAQTAQLVALGALGERDRESYAYGMSSDGVHIVGGSLASVKGVLEMRACRWVFPRDGGVAGPEALPLPRTETGFGSLATAVSDDGERVVGSIGLTLEYYFGPLYSPWHGMYWWDLSSKRMEADWVVEVMEFTDIAADGRVVCGTTRDPFFEPVPLDAIRWTGPGSRPETLGSLGGRGQAFACSADGGLIVGESYDAEAEAVSSFLWDEPGGMRPLPNSPSGIFHTAMGMSPDGRHVVGGVVADASVWSEDTGLMNIGRHPGSSWAYALDVSADGSVVVGSSVTDKDTRTLDAFIWDAGHGMRGIGEMLERDYGVDTKGWRFESATAVSDDGLTIVGYGVTPAGRREGWAVRLTLGGCAPDFNADGSVTSQDFFDFLAAFFNEHASADFNRDGVINSQDFFDYLVAFFAGC